MNTHRSLKSSIPVIILISLSFSLLFTSCQNSSSNSSSFKEGTFSGESSFEDKSDSAVSASCEEFIPDIKALGLNILQFSLFSGGTGLIHRYTGVDLASAKDAGLLATYDAANEQGEVTAEEKIEFAFDANNTATSGCVGTRTNTISAISDDKVQVVASIDAGCRSGRANFRCKYNESAQLERRG